MGEVAAQRHERMITRGLLNFPLGVFGLGSAFGGRGIVH